MAGLDRNQPLRRYLSQAGQRPIVHHLDPGVIYHWPGRSVVRGSSVESWIETCSELFPGEGIRDFWELIWNLSVYTWDFIDKLGREPWQKPNPGFPFLNPSFWRGARRTRLLFADSRSFIGRFPVQQPTLFLEWVETLVRFQYGAGLDSVPSGMMSLALNAPSESYLLGKNTTAASSNQPDHKQFPYSMNHQLRGDDESTDFNGAWKIPFIPGKEWQSQECQVHQVFFEAPVECLAAQTLVLVAPTSNSGHLFLRTQPVFTHLLEEMTCSLEQILTTTLGQDWGSVRWESAGRVSACPFAPGLPVEEDWPWLGCVRTLLLNNNAEGREGSG